MRNRTKLGTYHEIFMSIVSKTRIPISTIAKQMGRTGRGQRRATVSKYLSQMYEQKISLQPNLILKTFEYPKRIAYFCKKKSKSKIASTFMELRHDKRINYVLFISGLSDFFLTSRDENLDLKRYDLEIAEKSVLYTPIFTIPQGWRLSFEDAVKTLLNLDFKKGMLPRETEGALDWSDLDTRIFELMRENARRPFTEVAGETDKYSSTIKDHFYQFVLPQCEIAHYFFPKGYDCYMQNLFRIYTHYEKSLVKALEKLPCTTYVYPLEKGLVFIIFHENINIVMTFVEKMEENGILDKHLLFTPLRHYK